MSNLGATIEHTRLQAARRGLAEPEGALFMTWDTLAQKEGKHSTVFWVNSDHYSGEWRDNKQHGRGEFMHAKSGLKYDGEFAGGQRHGCGTLWKVGKGKKMRMVYEGEWAGGKKEGEGTMYFQNGDIYTGQWAGGKMGGEGKMAYSSGEYYEGGWANGLRHGRGVLTKESGDRYDGAWADGKKEGQGVYYYLARNQLYTGEWRDDSARCGTLEDIPGGEESLPSLGLEQGEDVVRCRVNTLRIERAAERAGSAPASFSLQQLASLEKGFNMVDQGGSGRIPTADLALIFEQFEAYVSQDECDALVKAVGTSEENGLTFDLFLKAMSILVEA